MLVAVIGRVMGRETGRVTRSFRAAIRAQDGVWSAPRPLASKA